jgi:hypothetical protein
LSAAFCRRASCAAAASFTLRRLISFHFHCWFSFHRFQHFRFLSIHDIAIDTFSFFFDYADIFIISMIFATLAIRQLSLIGFRRFSFFHFLHFRFRLFLSPLLP